MSDFEGLEVTAVSDDVSVEGGTPGKGTCPDCNKLLTITAAGALRSHKCVNDISTSGTTPKGVKAARPRTPTKVRNLGVAVIAGGVEYSAAAVVSRWAECPPSEVPSDLGDDADIMVGPILDAIWPRVPRKAQRVIKAIADESDLLLAAMAWWDWGKALKEWGVARQALNANQARPTRGYEVNGAEVPTTLNGVGPTGPLQPFAPDTVSNAPM